MSAMTRAKGPGLEQQRAVAALHGAAVQAARAAAAGRARPPAEALRSSTKEEPSLVVLDAELRTGSIRVAAIKAHRPRRPASILVAGKRLIGDQMREVSACGCDELLIAPMTADELHDVVAIQLGEPRPGTEAFAITVELARQAGRRDGVEPVGRRRAPRDRASPSVEGQAVDALDHARRTSRRSSIKGTAVWAQPRDGKTVVGVAFDRARSPRPGDAREAHAVAGRQRRRAHACRPARRLHRGDALRRAAAGDGRPRRVRHCTGHVHELARRSRLVRVPAPGAHPGLRVPRLLGAVRPAGVDGARRDRPRHGDVVLRAVPLHRLRPPGGAPAAVGGDPRVEPRAAGVQVPQLRRARSSSTTFRSATSPSSQDRADTLYEPCASSSCGRSRSHSSAFALLFGVEFFLEWRARRLIPACERR